jgi:FkbM family methyltransferase
MDLRSEILHIRAEGVPNELLFKNIQLTSFQLIQKEIFVNKVYNPDDRFIIHPGDTVIDIGANIGMFSIYAASIHPSVKVIAFEPAKDNFDALCENIQINNLKNITPYCYAISDFDEKSTTLYRDSIGGNHSLLRDTPSRILKGSKMIGKETVESRSLDSIFDDLNIQSCDFLKVDCEGGEHKIFPVCLLGTLMKIHRIALEYHDLWGGQTEDGLKQTLDNSGFTTTLKPDQENNWENVGMLYGIRK